MKRIPERTLARLAMILLISVQICVIFGLLYSHAALSLQISFADDQISMFEQMRTEALEAETKIAVCKLEYVVSYYPSGTKQRAGSRLDGLVERARQTAIRDIITHLRSKTRKDFGDDPGNWVTGLSQHRK